MKRDILLTIKQNKPPFIPLPLMVDHGFADLNTLTVFKENLVASGATYSTCCSLMNFELALKNHLGHEKIYSPIGNLCNVHCTTEHGYDDVDAAVYQGTVGVAENGAIFIDLSKEAHRSPLVLVKHLYILINESSIVDDMYQAYQRISLPFDYGVFVSGPSKTADIEQCLVIGAHGAKSLEVVIIQT